MRFAAAALAAGLIGLGTASAGFAQTRFEPAKTPKGLTFHHREDASTPFAAISFGLRDVYALTTPGKEGFNAFGTALVMQGVDGAGQTEFIERMKDLAAGASISFGPFSTQGNVRAPTRTIAASMALMAAALKGAVPSEKLLARLKQSAAAGEAQASLRAETIAQRAALRFALGEHPVTRGFDPSRFERIGRGDLAAWRKAVLDRSRLRLAASGRIGRDEAARIIDDAFADIPTLPPAPRADWPDVKLQPGTVVVEHDTPQSAIVLIGLTTIGAGREVETAFVANAVLGGSNGRLWQGIRVSLGTTYGASSGLQLAGPGKRLVVLRAAVDNAKVKATLDAMRGVYAKWRAEGVTAAELRANTSRMTTGHMAALDEPARANGLVIAMQLAGRAVDEIYSYESRMKNLDAGTLNAFIARKFPAPESLIAVIVTPRADGLGATCTIRGAEEAIRCRK